MLTGEYVYFFDLRGDRSSVRIGYSSGGPQRINSHLSVGQELLAVLPASKDYEHRLHEWFTSRGFSAPFDKSTSIYEGAEVWGYVEWLLARGYAAPTLEDAGHLPKAMWSAISPDNARKHCGADEIGQLALFKQDPKKRKEHTAAVAYHASESDEWFTPTEIIEAARRALGRIDLDPASCPAANSRVMAKHFWSQRQSGLDPLHEWQGTVWLNPPYGGLAQAFVERLFSELDAKSVSAAIVLLNVNAMTSRWFQPVTARAAAMLITNGRLRFEPGTPEQHFSSPSTGSVISYFGPNPQSFHDEFSRFGHILVHWDRSHAELMRSA